MWVEGFQGMSRSDRIPSLPHNSVYHTIQIFTELWKVDKILSPSVSANQGTWL